MWEICSFSIVAVLSPLLPAPPAQRDFMGRYPPRNFPLPPPNCTNKASIETIKRINEAAEALPDWDQHTA